MDRAEGHLAEIEFLYRRHGAALVLFASALTGERSRAQDAVHQLSASQRSELQNAMAALGDGLDWSSAAKRDVEALRGHYAAEPRASAALDRIVGSYGAYLKDPSKLPTLTDAISSAPPELASLIPNPKRVLEQKQDLADKLSQARALLQ